MAIVLDQHELPGNETSRRFEGALYGDVNISCFISATPPGRGPRRHTHPYEEVFIVQSGTLTFTAGAETIEAHGGKVVIVPAGVPHQFINSGTDVALHIDIHVAPQMVTTWLED